jgi:hypothetical protein
MTDPARLGAAQLKRDYSVIRIMAYAAAKTTGDRMNRITGWILSSGGRVSSAILPIRSEIKLHYDNQNRREYAQFGSILTHADDSCIQCVFIAAP